MALNGWLLRGLMVCLLVSTGCLVGVSSHTNREGTYVAESTLDQIEPGKTNKSWIVATLGEPSENKEVEPGHELWKYSYRETRNSSGYVFLIFGGSGTRETDSHVFVEMVDGVVTRTWRG